MTEHTKFRLPLIRGTAATVHRRVPDQRLETLYADTDTDEDSLVHFDDGDSSPATSTSLSSLLRNDALIRSLISTAVIQLPQVAQTLIEWFVLPRMQTSWTYLDDASRPTGFAIERKHIVDWPRDWFTAAYKAARQVWRDRGTIGVNVVLWVFSSSSLNVIWPILADRLIERGDGGSTTSSRRRQLTHKVLCITASTICSAVGLLVKETVKVPVEVNVRDTMLKVSEEERCHEVAQDGLAQGHKQITLGVSGSKAAQADHAGVDTGDMQAPPGTTSTQDDHTFRKLVKAALTLGWSETPIRRATPIVLTACLSAFIDDFERECRAGLLSSLYNVKDASTEERAEAIKQNDRGLFYQSNMPKVLIASLSTFAGLSAYIKTRRSRALIAWAQANIDEGDAVNLERRRIVESTRSSHLQQLSTALERHDRAEGHNSDAAGDQVLRQVRRTALRWHDDDSIGGVSQGNELASLLHHASDDVDAAAIFGTDDDTPLLEPPTASRFSSVQRLALESPLAEVTEEASVIPVSNDSDGQLFSTPSASHPSLPAPSSPLPSATTWQLPSVDAEDQRSAHEERAVGDDTGQEAAVYEDNLEQLLRLLQAGANQSNDRRIAPSTSDGGQALTDLQLHLVNLLGDLESSDAGEAGAAASSREVLNEGLESNRHDFVAGMLDLMGGQGGHNTRAEGGDVTMLDRPEHLVHDEERSSVGPQSHDLDAADGNDLEVTELPPSPLASPRRQGALIVEARSVSGSSGTGSDGRSAFVNLAHWMLSAQHRAKQRREWIRETEERRLELERLHRASAMLKEEHDQMVGERDDPLGAEAALRAQLDANAAVRLTAIISARIVLEDALRKWLL
ncbi:unnamed protein product [Jaminaea pallidilutea]